jgi:hypothetical protein
MPLVAASVTPRRSSSARTRRLQHPSSATPPAHGPAARGTRSYNHRCSKRVCQNACSNTNPQMPKCQNACSNTNPQMPKCLFEYESPNAKCMPKCLFEYESPNAQIHTHLPVMTSSTEQRASRRCRPPTATRRSRGGMPQLAGPAGAADLHAPVMNSLKEPRASRTRPPARSSTLARYPSSAAGCWMAAAVGKGGREGSKRGVGIW